VPPTNHREPAPPKGYVVSFVTFHERGLGMPPSRFMRVILHYYGVELHHLAPNSVSQATIFVAVCEGYLGVPKWRRRCEEGEGAATHAGRAPKWRMAM
jgi:hypothetical protein